MAGGSGDSSPTRDLPEYDSDYSVRVESDQFGQHSHKKSLVLKTWQGTLLEEGSLPEDWTTINGVLVGIIK